MTTASALFVSVAAASGCGSGSSYSASNSLTTSPSPTSTPTSTIMIVGRSGTQAFTPNPASFGGQQVVFKNNDTVTHHIVFNDGSVDTGNIAPGATSGAVAFPGSGVNYHCVIHPGMIGSSEGTSGTPPPMCTGPYCNAY